MSELQAICHPDYVRGVRLLERKMETPADFYAFWRVYGSFRARQVPEIEKCFPWWEGFSFGDLD